MHLYINELLEEHQCVDPDLRFTVAYDEEKGLIGLAFQNPKDNYVRGIGRTLASERMNIRAERNLSKSLLVEYLKMLLKAGGYFPKRWTRVINA